MESCTAPPAEAPEGKRRREGLRCLKSEMEKSQIALRSPWRRAVRSLALMEAELVGAHVHAIRHCTECKRSSDATMQPREEARVGRERVTGI